MENNNLDANQPQNNQYGKDTNTRLDTNVRRKDLILLVGALVVLGIIGGVLLDTQRSTSPANNEPTAQEDGTDNVTLGQAAQVDYTDKGFTPETIRVKTGQTVTWTNNHAGLLVVASNPHPEHTDEEGLESQTIDQDADYSHTFSEPGAYTYHNHLKPEVGGTVVVE